jgi:hypothetical protein
MSVTYDDIFRMLAGKRINRVHCELSRKYTYINIHFGGYLVEYWEKNKEIITLDSLKDCIAEGYGENLDAIMQKHIDTNMFYGTTVVPEYNLWFTNLERDKPPIDAVLGDEPIFASDNIPLIDKFLDLMLVGQTVSEIDASNLDAELGGLINITFSNGFLIMPETNACGLVNNLQKVAYNFSSHGITSFKE